MTVEPGSARDVVFLSAVRTPFGTFGGALRDVSAVDLAAHAARAALDRAGVDRSDVGHTVFGNVLQSTADCVYFARHAALKAGCPTESGALTVNRLCGSGFQAVVSGAMDILLSETDVCLVGGGESMSTAPHVTRGLRWGVPLGRAPAMEDLLWECLTDSYVGLPMAQTAENVAAKYGIDRQCSDDFALRSQTLARDAWAAGVYDDEVIAIDVVNPKSKKTESFARDEHMRPDSTAEGLAKLRLAFPNGKTVTAGNASGIGDGAAALVLASASFAHDRGLRPLGRLVSWGVAGVDPALMGIGPAPASRIALQRAGLTMGDMSLIEVNEAFAPQACAVQRELDIPTDRLNVHGGAIALSHPLAASGARISAHLLHALRASGGRYGLGTACIGGGQGIAVIIESLG